MGAPLELRVECYAGYKADEKPTRFYIGEGRYEVEEVLDQWYSPNDTYFRVRADDGNIYVLRHTEHGSEDVWTLESFRRP
jgi:hypothetical protein